MKKLLIIVGLLGLFSSCRQQNRQKAEDEAAVQDTLVVWKEAFSPDTFPLRGEVLYFIEKKYATRDGTQERGADVFALLPEEKQIIIDAYRSGKGELIMDERWDGHEVNLSVYSYWAFTDTKHGTEETVVLPYTNTNFGKGFGKGEVAYALFGNEHRRVILTKENQRKVDSIIEKYDLGRRYDRKYPIDTTSRKRFCTADWKERFDTVGFYHKAIQQADFPDCKIMGYRDTLPNKTIVEYSHRKTAKDASYRKEITNLDFVQEVRIYDKNGLLKEQYWAINTQEDRIGYTYRFDESGGMRTTNEDEGFKISFQQFRDILWRNAFYMPNYIQNETIYGRSIAFFKGIADEKFAVQYRVGVGTPYYGYIDGDLFRVVEIYVNGITGQIISKEVFEVLEDII